MLPCSKVPRFQPRLERRGNDCQCWRTFPPCGKRQALLQHRPRGRTQWQRLRLRLSQGAGDSYVPAQWPAARPWDECQTIDRSLPASVRNNPDGSFVTGVPAEAKLRATRSLRAWCIVVLPGAFLQTKLWSPLLLLLYYYYYMYYMGLLYVVIYFCLRDEHATRNNFPPTRILTALQRRRGNIGKKLTCVRISVSDCYWVVYFSFAYLPINVKNFVHRHRIYKYGFVYSRDVISFYTNRTLMRLNLHIIALPTIGRGLPVCSCRKMWLSQLNSTENYGRRCLTPPSPHRNYILS